MCLKQCARLHGAGDEVKGGVPSLSPSFLKKIGTDNTETLVTGILGSGLYCSCYAAQKHLGVLNRN